MPSLPRACTAGPPLVRLVERQKKPIGRSSISTAPNHFSSHCPIRRPDRSATVGMVKSVTGLRPLNVSSIAMHHLLARPFRRDHACHDRPDAGAADDVDRYAMVSKRPTHAIMRDAARPATRQHQPDGTARHQSRQAFNVAIAADVMMHFHIHHVEPFGGAMNGRGRVPYQRQVDGADGFGRVIEAHGLERLRRLAAARNQQATSPACRRHD